MSTPYLGMVLPTPSVTVGPEWASELITALTDQIDPHDHTSGKGVQVPSAGLNINADVPTQNNNFTQLRSSRYNAQSAALGGASDVGCVYVSGVDLWFNDGNGNQIQLTASGALNAASVGGIGGDYATSTASVAYATATKTFTFLQATNKSAWLDIGNLTIHSQAATSTHGISLISPTGLAADYTLTLLTALPASTKILTVDSSGNMGAAYDVDGSTLQVVSNAIGIANSGVGTTQIANLAVTGAKIANLTITASKISPATITAAEIASATITGTQMANNSISSGQLVSNAVTTGKILDGAVTLAKTALTLTWTAPTGGSGWTVTTAKYSSVDAFNLVHLAGAITQSSGSPAATIFTLPSGRRPASTRIFPIASAGTVVQLTVNTDGTVTISANPGNGLAIHLDGVYFSIDV